MSELTLDRGGLVALSYCVSREREIVAELEAWQIKNREDEESYRNSENSWFTKE